VTVTGDARVAFARAAGIFTAYVTAAAQECAQASKRSTITAQDVLDAVEEAGIADETIIIFTSDHGYHLGEHDFWAKVSLLDESSQVPLIISVPGKKPAVCNSFAELLDLYPTTASLCGLEVPARIQGKDISRMLDDPKHEVREAAFSVSGSRRGLLLRDDQYAFIQYAEDASKGIELYDVKKDPAQFTNLAEDKRHKATVEAYKAKLAAKLKDVRTNDLGLKY